MSDQHTATYLNDHLAGSVVATELLTHVERLHAGSAVAEFAAELRVEIEADRNELVELMGRLSVPTSGPRAALAWLSEKLMQLKMKLDDKAEGALRLLEVWETVSVGIEGKKLLWTSLRAASESGPNLCGPDYFTLIRRAVQQRERVEQFRLEAAIAVLTAGSITTV
jgi:hypothetical protein